MYFGKIKKLWKKELINLIREAHLSQLFINRGILERMLSKSQYRVSRAEFRY